MKIGFIGLGNMGNPMARSLIAAGYYVTGYDIAKVEGTIIPLASSARTLASESDIIILMLNNYQVVNKVMLDILPVMSKDSLLIDCSTIDIAGTKKCVAHCDIFEIGHVDAPVSGGVAAAESGSLTFMVGGTNHHFNKAKPLLEAMAKKVVHCGDSGAGQAAKICNNMMLGISMIATCEGFALADKLGLDRNVLYDVVSGASGQSWSLTSYCPVPGVGPQSPADNGYKPGFAADLMLKDLRLSQIAAESEGLHTHMGALATELYRRFVEDGQGSGQDFSAMLNHIAK
ncbi:MAG: 3-hydroxyisobutyrate dehydrogenase [Candidatus Puniceispirillaceae bacterium]